MGQNFVDRFSLLHFAAGVIAYFFGIPLGIWVLIHIIFEIVENTPFGIHFINTYLNSIWPGGKDAADSFLNSLGDVFFSTIGWISGYLVSHWK